MVSNEKNGRSKKVIFNILIIVLMQIMSFIYSLISKRLFIDSFSISTYGVIDLFSSFFRSLMLLELGFGTILIFNLYKPFAENDLDEIKKQLSYFKTIYLIISIIILVISGLAGFYLYDIFNIDCNDKILVYEVYLLNIFQVLVKYHFLHKISIINATGDKYIENIVYIIAEGISFIFRIVSLKVWHSEKLYVLSLLMLPLMMYFINSIWIDKKYKIVNIPYASVKDVYNSGVLSQCKKYIYATIYSLAFVSMDNIIISVKLSTDSIAYVTNYMVLLNIGKDFMVTVMQSLRGNMAGFYNTNKSNEGLYEVYDILSCLNLLLTSIIVVGFGCLIDDFIVLWLGSEYIIDKILLIVLLMNLLIDTLFGTLENVFVIKGYIFLEKWPLIISAAANIVLSIVLIDYIGLKGVYIGTFVALLIKWIGKFSYVVGGVFKNRKKKVVLKNIFYFSFVVLQLISINAVVNAFVPEVNSFVYFLIKCFIVVVLTIIFNLFVMISNKNLRTYIMNLVK